MQGQSIYFVINKVLLFLESGFSFKMVEKFRCGQDSGQFSFRFKQVLSQYLYFHIIHLLLKIPLLLKVYFFQENL